MVAKITNKVRRLNSLKIWSAITGVALVVALVLTFLPMQVSINTDGLLSISLNQAQANPDWLSGWDNRVKLTTDQTDIDADLTNFPILLYLSSSSGRNVEDISFVFDELQSNSKKIAVTTSDETTQCYVEIEKWDYVNRQAWLWVSANVSGSTDTDFYLYYDKDHADNTGYVGDTNSAVAANVWDSYYKLVAHFNEASGTFYDSTANNMDTTVQSGVTYAQTGQLYRSVNINGYGEATPVGGYLQWANSALLSPGAGTFTIEVLVKATDINCANGNIFRDYGVDTDNQFISGISGTKWYIEYRDAEGDSANTLSTNVVDTNWVLLGGVRDGTTVRLYRNGAQDTTNTNTNLGTITTSDGVVPATAYPITPTTYGFPGYIDELRVSQGIARSAAWQKATYETGRDNLLDWGIGEEPLNPVTGFTYWKAVNITGQSGAGTSYIVKLSIGESSGASGEDFDVGTHCSDFPNDIAFSNDDNTDDLQYELQLPMAGTTPNRLATFWVKVSDNLDTNQTIRCYYGKAGADSVSQHVVPVIENFDFRSSGAWNGNCVGVPHAVYYSGTYNKTYWGFIRQNSDIVVKSYDHATGAVDEYVVATIESDSASDHNSPTLLMRNDGRLVAFWIPSQDYPTRYIYCRVTTNVEDITAWNGTITALDWAGYDAVFPSAIQLSGESNKVYCFYRYDNTGGTPMSIGYSTSTDGCLTWSGPYTLVEGSGSQWSYTWYASNANTIYFEYSTTPTESTNHNIWAFYYTNGYLYKPDGTQLCATPASHIHRSDLTGSALVYDETAGGHYDAWGWDIAMNSTGSPYLVFATFANINTDHRYNYASWNGSSWNEYEITTAGAYYPDVSGHEAYSGGISIDKEDPTTVYFAKQVSGVFEIQKGVTTNGGVSWTFTDITSGSTLKNGRPMVVTNHSEDFPILWMVGPYNGWEPNEFSTRLTNKRFDDIWSIVDPVGTSVCLEQNKQFEIRNPHTGTRPNFTDYFKSGRSVTSRLALVQNHLTWTTDSVNEAQGGAYLYFDNNNYAGITPRTTLGGKLRLEIWQGGAKVYSYDTSIAKNQDVRVTYNFTSYETKFYYLNGATWTQLNATQTYNLGTVARVCLSAVDTAAYTGANPIIIDNLYFRSIVETEPSFSTAGTEQNTIDIINTPSTNDFGVLPINTSASTSINYFTITNTGGCTIDVVIYSTDLTGGDDTWDLSDTATPGENIYGLYAGLDDADDAFDVIVRETPTYNTLVSGLVEDATQAWGLKLYMPTSLSGYDAQQMSGTVTLVASASS